MIHSSYALEFLPGSWFGIALLLLGFMLFVVDLQVTNHGLPTVGGLVALAPGVLMLFDTMAPYLWVLLVAVAAVVILLGVLFVGALRQSFLTTVRALRTLFLDVLSPIRDRRTSGREFFNRLVNLLGKCSQAHALAQHYVDS